MIFGILGGHTYGFENYTKGQAPLSVEYQAY